MLLQQTGYFLWAQALDIMGRPTEHVAELYAKRTSAQVSEKQKPCGQNNLCGGSVKEWEILSRKEATETVFPEKCKLLDTKRLH